MIRKNMTKKLKNNLKKMTKNQKNHQLHRMVIWAQSTVPRTVNLPRKSKKTKMMRANSKITRRQIRTLNKMRRNSHTILGSKRTTANRTNQKKWLKMKVHVIRKITISRTSLTITHQRQMIVVSGNLNKAQQTQKTRMSRNAAYNT